MTPLIGIDNDRHYCYMEKQVFMFCFVFLCQKVLALLYDEFIYAELFPM